LERRAIRQTASPAERRQGGDEMVRQRHGVAKRFRRDSTGRRADQTKKIKTPISPRPARAGPCRVKLASCAAKVAPSVVKVGPLTAKAHLSAAQIDLSFIKIVLSIRETNWSAAKIAL